MAVEDWCLAHARISGKRHKRVALDDKMAFFQQLATLVSSGTPLLEAITISAEQTQSIRLRAILREIAGRVAAGGSLHAILGDYREIFEDHWIAVIGTGEVSGKMGMVLCELNVQIRESCETRRKIVGSLTYPIILIIVAVAVVACMLWFVVPTFANMFREMNAELPSVTQYVMSASNFIVAHGIYIVLGIVALAAAVGQYLRTEPGRRRVGAIGLVMPMVGDLMIQSAMYRFASNLGLLLKSGVPMLETLSTLSTVFRSSPLYRDAILRARNRVAAGQPLADSLEETGLFTSMMTNIVRLGEASATPAAASSASVAPSPTTGSARRSNFCP